MTDRRGVTLVLAGLLVLLGLHTVPAVAQPKFGPSESAPGGLSRSKTPQFIVMTHDDDVTSSSSKLVRSISDKVKNPNGCKMPVTWFALTKTSTGQFDCDAAMDLYERGHEIGVHTKSHSNLRNLKYDKVKDEIKGSRQMLIDCGLPKDKVVGFRTPYLADSEAVRKVLFREKFRYDSTLGVHGGKNHLWPATMERFSPFDCNVAGNKCKQCKLSSTSCESYPGMWEVPLVETDSTNLMDYCTEEYDGSPMKNCDAYEQLMGELEASLDSKRAPVTVGIHSPYLRQSDGKYAKAVGKFLKDALDKRVDGKKVVWAVTMSQLLDWMESPVPLDKMESFMAKYTCSK